ncbi:MAG: preprotein translocase subunit YajC [Bacteroidales bacterium]|nr:preprotein translocase subunit YajC [Bacteroidales bacterium]
MLLLDIPNGWKTVIMIVLMIAVFYFFLIRPQSQQAKKEAAYRNGLKPGDEVMTQGGIHARFVSASQGQATIEVAEGVRWHVQLSTLSPVPVPKRR